MLRGRFRFYGETVEVAPGVSVFDLPPPSRAWAEGVARFAWLPPLAAAGGDAARTLATNLIAQWVKRYAHYSEPDWAPHVMARRLMHIFSHGRLVVLEFRHAVALAIVRVAARTGARCWSASPAKRRTACRGWKRPRRWRCPASAWTTVPSGLERGLTRLEDEIARQILPDGGHVSRSPEELLNAYRHLMMVMDALAAVDEEPPHSLAQCA